MLACEPLCVLVTQRKFKSSKNSTTFFLLVMASLLPVVFVFHDENAPPTWAKLTSPPSSGKLTQRRKLRSRRQGLRDITPGVPKTTTMTTAKRQATPCLVVVVKARKPAFIVYEDVQ